MNDIAEQLELAGVDVIVGREVGRTDNVDGIEWRQTFTPEPQEGAADVNEIVSPGRGHFYVQRTGRVWMLAFGPLPNQRETIVYVAAEEGEDPTDEQAEAVAVLDAVLTGVYAAEDGTSDDED